jgi:hypothetical protein
VSLVACRVQASRAIQTSEQWLKPDAAAEAARFTADCWHLGKNAIMTWLTPSAVTRVAKTDQSAQKTYCQPTAVPKELHML